MNVTIKHDCTEGVVKSSDVHVYAGDAEIHGIRSIDVKYRVDAAVSAKLELFLQQTNDIAAVALFVMRHPITGEHMRVRHIQFEDGSMVDFTGPDLTGMGDQARVHASAA